MKIIELSSKQGENLEICTGIAANGCDITSPSVCLSPHSPPTPVELET